MRVNRYSVNYIVAIEMTYETLIDDYQKKIYALEKRKKLILEAKPEVIREGLLLSYANQHRRLMESFYAECITLRDESRNQEFLRSASQQLSDSEVRINKNRKCKGKLYKRPSWLKKLYKIWRVIINKDTNVSTEQTRTTRITDYMISENRSTARRLRQRE